MDQELTIVSRRNTNTSNATHWVCGSVPKTSKQDLSCCLVLLEGAVQDLGNLSTEVHPRAVALTGEAGIPLYHLIFIKSAGRQNKLLSLYSF